MVMAAWVYFFLPETNGYALEDIKYLFEKDVIVRSLEDSPGGRVFLRGRRATPVEEMKRAAGVHDSSDIERKGDEESNESIEVADLQI